MVFGPVSISPLSCLLFFLCSCPSFIFWAVHKSFAVLRSQFLTSWWDFKTILTVYRHEECPSPWHPSISYPLASRWIIISILLSRFHDLVLQFQVNLRGYSSILHFFENFQFFFEQQTKKLSILFIFTETLVNCPKVNELFYVDAIGIYFLATQHRLPHTLLHSMLTFFVDLGHVDIMHWGLHYIIDLCFIDNVSIPSLNVAIKKILYEIKFHLNTALDVRAL